MIRNPIAPVAAAILAVVAAAGGNAGEAQDRIFRVGLLAEVGVGQSVVFARDREGDAGGAASPPIQDGEIEVAVSEEQGRRVAQVELRSPGQPPSLTRLPADGGHPVLLVFLETTARTMAEATGGSPFYIRNRIREALGKDVALDPVEIPLGDATVSGQAATFRPFLDDPNREKMGPFADLALTMVLSDAAPGGFARFEAVAGPAGADEAFRETMVFERIESESP